MKVAALDLGTNTFLCLIAEGDRNGITRVHKDLVQVVRLGQGVGQTGEFHVEALQRARQCLTDFKKEIEAQKVDRILAMATSAARDARNGQELFKIGEDLGIPIEIIPGEDEARITYQGATAGGVDTTKTSLVIDVGGGSTELIVGLGEKILFGQSLDIGGVRLTERFVKNQPVPAAQRQSVQDFIRSQIDTVLSQLKQQDIQQVIAVAGTPTSIVAIEVGGFDEKGGRLLRLKRQIKLLGGRVCQHHCRREAREISAGRSGRYYLCWRFYFTCRGGSFKLTWNDCVNKGSPLWRCFGNTSQRLRELFNSLSL